jgi:hypothetical protein
VAEWVDIPLATQLGEEVPGGASYVSDAELLNLMLKENPPGSRTPFHISHTPGLTTTGIATPGSGIIRGMCVSLAQGFVWVVQGTTIYVGGHPFAAGNWSSIGTMPGTQFCRMVDSGTHIVVVDGTNARAFTASPSTATPSIEGFIDVAYQDGYTIYAKNGDDLVYVSSLDDPTTIGALDFTTVDALTGDIVGIISDHRELFVFKNSSIEHFYNAGGSGFPFQRASPGLIEKGAWSFDGNSFYGVCTIAKHENSVFWVGSDLRVYMMRGYQPAVISTPWVERRLTAAITSASTAVLTGSTFTSDGSAFYCIGGIGGVPTTFVYDIKRGLWHERGSGGLTITHVVNTPSTAGYEYAIAAVKGASSSTLYRLDPTVATDAGAAITRTMTLPQFAPASGRRTFMPELYIDMQKASTSGNVTLSWSDDGGTTFTSGTTSAANVPRTRWQRLGSFFQRILRFTFAINSKLAITGVRARIEVGE